MADLRIFSYLPNPRVFKATIAARLVDVDVEIRGGKASELTDWLWDFDARPLTPADTAQSDTEHQAKRGFKGNLRKTDAFLRANPFGTVPVGFSPDGRIGIFESNSIMRAVARLGEGRFPLYGQGPYEAAQVDAFLDVGLVFARDTQVYMLELSGEAISATTHARAAESLQTYLSGIEQTLAGDTAYLVGDGITLADICFTSELAELALFCDEGRARAKLDAAGLAPIIDEKTAATYPGCLRHYGRLRRHPAFTPDLKDFPPSRILAAR
jgi:glutathione S-transferase